MFFQSSRKLFVKQNYSRGKFSNAIFALPRKYFQVEPTGFFLYKLYFIGVITKNMRLDLFRLTAFLFQSCFRLITIGWQDGLICYFYMEDQQEMRLFFLLSFKFIKHMTSFILKSVLWF